jgi:catechol 2,3-dioxygenase-like lactoylglutathione lyase family enzyme
MPLHLTSPQPPTHLVADTHGLRYETEAQRSTAYSAERSAARSAERARLLADVPAAGSLASLSATVTSTIIFVADLRRSVDFYERVFGCRVSLLEDDAALMLAPDGFQLYLVSRGPRSSRASGSLGEQYFTWAVDSMDDLNQIAAELKTTNDYIDSHETEGVTFVQGRDPDDGRIIISYPSPRDHPRTSLDSRFYS